MNKNGHGMISKPNRYPHIPKVAGIYMIKEKTTGKAYIGSSSNVNLRLTNYTSNICGHIEGIVYDDCEFIFLADCRYLTARQRLELEEELIIKHNTIYPVGYNKRSPITCREFGKPVAPKKQSKTTNYGKPAKAWINVL